MIDGDGKKYSHVIFVRKALDRDGKRYDPIFRHSLKEAYDESEAIIKRCPDAECDIFMLRTELAGEIKIHRKDHIN